MHESLHVYDIAVAATYGSYIGLYDHSYNSTSRISARIALTRTGQPNRMWLLYRVSQKKVLRFDS